jgi:hypothetical protein
MCFRAYITNVGMMNLLQFMVRAVALRLGLICIYGSPKLNVQEHDDVIGSVIFICCLIAIIVI